MNTEVEWLIMLIIVIIMFVFCSSVAYHRYSENKKKTNGVNNYDEYTRSYCYLVGCDKQDIINGLKLRNAADTIDFTFDEKDMTITFSGYGYLDVKYKLTFCEADNKLYMKMTACDSVLRTGNNGYMGFYINSFWIEKFGMTAVHYR